MPGTVLRSLIFNPYHIGGRGYEIGPICASVYTFGHLFA